MIPILYSVDEFTFTSNGIGRLTECASCTVTEERNGIYECEFVYPITGKHYNVMVTNGGIVGVIHDDHHDVQLFDIYAHTDPIDGMVTFNAHHISYRLANIILEPFDATSIGEAFTVIPLKAINDCPFTFHTDKATAGEFKLTKPDNARAILAGQQGSILDVFGSGDYKFNNFAVWLYTNRGVETDVTIRYGKNLVDIVNKVDDSGSYSAIIPYWVGGEDGEETIYGDMVISDTLRAVELPWTNENLFEIEDGSNNIIYFRKPIITPKAVDFSTDFEYQPTPEQLEDRAKQYMKDNETWERRQNIKVDFAQLWQTPEYESIAALQRVSLCDLVSVYYPEMGIIQNSQKVIKVVYNVLLERYDSMELGMAQSMLSELFENDANEIVKQETNELLAIMRRQSALITGGLGGHVVFNFNADGKPQEILIMDTDDIATAIHVIRMNRNGIGFSTNGYQGPYTSAWTIEGVFNADFIAAGSILANYIKGGTLTLGGYGNINGQLAIIDANGNTTGRWTNSGIVTNEFRAYFDDYFIHDGYLTVGNTGFFVTAESGKHLAELRFASLQDSGGTRYYPIGWHLVYDDGSTYCDIDMDPGYFYVSHGYRSGSSAEADSKISYNGWLTNNAYKTRIDGGLLCDTIYVSGTKTRLVETKEYGNRLLYCYETPTPMFADVGEGVIDETGLCYVFLDPVFAETITTNQYQVFLQRYGAGDCYVSERKHGYFVVTGEPGLKFGWELKAKQRDYDQLRLEQDISYDQPKNTYGEQGSSYYIDLMEGRIAS